MKLKVGDVVRCERRRSALGTEAKALVGIIIEFDQDGDPVVWTDDGTINDYAHRMVLLREEPTLQSAEGEG
jgi:hypothetical protein